VPAIFQEKNHTTMKELDEIIYDALTANETLAADTGGRIFSTCIEVPPTDDDNTPLPYIIVAEEASQNNLTTKDDVWESQYDIVNVGVIINAASPNEVKRLRQLVRKAVTSHVINMAERPYLQNATRDGIAWDWMKPCYFDTIHYQCEVNINLDENEQV
jgi:hypothetical protein